jgi:hypothetical protein
MKKKQETLIDESFIEYVRLNINITHFRFEDIPEKSLVPDNLTHDYLLRNFNINESIKRFYYAPTRNLISDEDFQKKVDFGYKGRIDRTLRPYPINIYGAYFGRKAMYYRLLMLMELDKDVTLKGVTIKYLGDLAPYFKEYAQGFESGFNNFKKECIDPFLIEFSNKKDYINKVFEFLTKQIIFEHSWFNNHTGFSINDNPETRVKKIVGAFEDGVTQGYYYKAWSIVFSNSQLFKPLFEAYYKENKNQKSEETPKIKKIKTAKYYAFYHWVLIKLGKESQFELNENDKYPANSIKNYASRKYKQCSPTRFYQSFTKDIDITNETATAKYLGKGYKEKIKIISNNDAEVMSFLKKYPN